MESEFNYSTEVRLADMLPLLDAQVCQAYLCHYVAYLLRDVISKHPKYQEFYDDLFVGSEDKYHVQRNHAIPYYFLVRDIDPIHHDDIQSQVIPQINEMIIKIRPDLAEMVTYLRISEIVMSKFVRGDEVGAPYFYIDSAAVRYETIKKILDFDPDAKLTINL